MLCLNFLIQCVYKSDIEHGSDRNDQLYGCNQDFGNWKLIGFHFFFLELVLQSYVQINPSD